MQNETRAKRAQMSAYFVINLKVTNPSKVEQYSDEVASLVEEFGGRYLVRGGNYDVLEGKWDADRVVVVEFPSFEAVKSFHASGRYAYLHKICTEGAVSSAIAIEGVSPLYA